MHRALRPVFDVKLAKQTEMPVLIRRLGDLTPAETLCVQISKLLGWVCGVGQVEKRRPPIMQTNEATRERFVY